MKLVITSEHILILVLMGIFFYINGTINHLHETTRKRVSFKEDPQIYVYEPHQEPRRDYDSAYMPRMRDTRRINIPTRGEPPSYQQVGLLQDVTDPNNIKPLYGRQTYRGSNKWNYFTSTDSHLATKIPITLETNDCTDERGCTELQKNQTITLLQTDYQVIMYGTTSPRYIPY
jgi:hypothetical protein